MLECVICSVRGWGSRAPLERTPCSGTPWYHHNMHVAACVSRMCHVMSPQQLGLWLPGRVCTLLWQQPELRHLLGVWFECLLSDLTITELLNRT